MPYLFAFLVALNATYFGYHVIQDIEPVALQSLSNITQNDFPVTLQLVSQKSILEQIKSLSIKRDISIDTLKDSAS